MTAPIRITGEDAVNDDLDRADSYTGGGRRTATFPKVGMFYEGEIADLARSQRTVYGSGQPEWWDDAQTRPKLQTEVTISTDLDDGPNEAGEPDDGRRTVFLKGASMEAALREARAGRPLRIGGWMRVEYTGNRGNAKQYAVEYEPPSGDDEGSADSPPRSGRNPADDVQQAFADAERSQSRDDRGGKSSRGRQSRVQRRGDGED